MKKRLKTRNSKAFFSGGVTSRCFKIATLASVTVLGVGTNAAAQAKTPLIIPKLGNDSAFSYDANINNINNTVTLYEYDNTGITKAIDYEISLKNTQYGDINANTTRVYNVDFLNNNSINISASFASDALEDRVRVNGSDFSSVDYSGNYVDLNTDANNGSYTYGGAISNYTGKIGDVSGLFVGNSSTNSASNAWGGALYIYGSSGSVDADFIGNYSYSSYSDAYGGAFAVENASSQIDTVTGSFIGNYSDGKKNAYGGAVFVNTGAKINTLTGNFIGNFAKSSVSNGVGGAVYVNSTSEITNIKGDFIGNYVDSVGHAWGGAIEHQGIVRNITGDFIGNHIVSDATGRGGAISSLKNGCENITGNFIENYVEAKTAAGGGAIHVSGGVENIEGNFVGNFVNSSTSIVYGGALYVDGNCLEVKNITGDFIKNFAVGYGSSYGGAISNYSKIGEVTGNFIGNYTIAKNGPALGGAIYNDSGEVDKLINTSFIGNHAKSETGEAQGGAVWTNKDLNFISDNGTTEFTGNYTDSAGTIDDNAIWVDSDSATLTFNLKNSGKTILNDNIDGKTGYNVNITGDNTGTFYLFNDMRNADVSFGNLNQLNTINNVAHVYNLNSLTLNSNVDFVADVDLAAGEMDRFYTNNNYTIAQGATLNVAGMNLLSDATQDTTRIMFAENGLKDNVTTTVSEVAYTPIYKYNVSYDKSGEEGYFVFTRGAGSAIQNGSSFNPAVLGGSTSATVGAIGTVNQTFNHAFGNADTFMNIPYLERVSMKNRNKYALSITGDATDMGRFSPLYQPNQEQSSVWVKPYATFETVGLKNGPKVHNNTYGTLVGFDSEMQSLRRGWDRVITGYIGYNGASQRYSGVDSIQNGGLIGGTVTMYKGNFFNATTVSVGANVAQNETMYGKDDFAMLLSGVGNKTGYNFEFKEGKLILQPSMLMSYTFVNTFDYTNAAGVRIDNKPLHALQLAPGLKVIGNLKDGWQPYASVSMVWNLMGESDATANGVKLPEMSIKPYVQYGVGVQKRIKDHFTAYGQAMIQNGGRNGISLTGGFRWALGRDKCKYEEQKVEGVNDKSKTLSPTLSLGEGANSSKKIIKQMTPQQRAALAGGKYMNTSRTAKSGSLRQY